MDAPRHPHRPRPVLALAAALATALALAAPGRAAPGAIDRSFAGGHVATDLGHGDDLALAVAVGDDGRIVAAGRAQGPRDRDVVLLRLSPDGAPDPSFAARGVALLDLGGDDVARALVLAEDGSLLVAGSSGAPSDFVVLRRRADGSADQSFGADGAVRTSFGGDDHATALALEVSGRLIIAGFTRAERERIALARYLPEGRLDRTFGEGGTATTALGARARAHAVALQRDGKIVVAGVADGAAVVLRYLPSGALDPTFGTGGSVRLALHGPVDGAAALHVAADGRILLAASQARGGRRIALARLDTRGAPDARFGSDGLVLAGLEGHAVLARALAVDRAGRAVVAGSVAGEDGDDLLLARFRPDGRLDDAFGRVGFVRTDLAGSADGAHALALQPDGRIVVAGGTGGVSNVDLLVARYTLDPARCGDGLVDHGESCDDGPRNGTRESCCTGECELRPSGTPCRAPRGACDLAETCDGTSGVCPPDRFAPADLVCRPAAGACDVPERCSGEEPACPADRLRERGVPCRPAAGLCDLAEACDGRAAACPDDRKSTARCRAARDACDAAEWCGGVANDCPPDASLPDGAACDDGLACTLDDACRAGACVGGTRDAFACSGYLCATVRASSRIAGTPPDVGAAAAALDADVGTLRSLCIPALTARERVEVVAGEGPLEQPDPSPPAYTAYRLAPGAARHGARRGVTLTLADQWGRVTFTAKRARLVSTTALLGDAASRAVPAAGPTLRCHDVDEQGPRRRGPRREVPVRALGGDSVRLYEVRRLRSACFAVPGSAPAAPGAGVSEAEAFLCYEARPAKGQERLLPQAAPLVVTNGFETQLVAALGKEQLCVPAIVEDTALESAAREPSRRRKTAKQRSARRSPPWSARRAAAAVD